MKDMERQEFERDLRDAFHGAEISPPDNLWTNIELDLEKAEGGQMKKRLFYYKLMAAASITFAICVAGIGAYFYSQQYEGNGIAHTNVPSLEQTNTKTQNAKTEANDKTLETVVEKSEATSNELVRSHQSADMPSSTSAENNLQNEKRLTARSGNDNNLTKGNAENGKKRLTQKYPDNDQSHIVSNQSYRVENNNLSQPAAVKLISDEDMGTSTSELIADASLNNSEDVSSESTVRNKIKHTISNSAKQGRSESDPNEFFNNQKLKPFVYTEKIKLNIEQEQQQDPVAIMMAKLQAREDELMKGEDIKIKKKEAKEVDGEKVWTALAVAAGANTSASRPGNTPDNIYSLGLGVGTKVTNRWVVQGGISYLTQLSSGQANEVLTADALSTFRVASTTESSNLKNNQASNQSQQLVGTAKYDANSQAQFISVPVQAGYLAVNRKFGLLVNAGVATNLFIRNTITPESDMIKKSSQNMGEKESDYNPVNFNGLLNTEISYKLGKHYRLALNPGLRYPLGSVYKSATNITATPLTMDIGVKFRYIFH